MQSNDIFKTYQVRKKYKEKTKFIDYLTGRLNGSGYSPNVENEGKILKSRNVVVGDPQKAKIVFSAHYDTCAWCPIPNMMFPTNPLLWAAYQLFMNAFILFWGIVALIIAIRITDNADISIYVFDIVVLGFLYQIMFGFRNKHTANDNTSGVLTLINILEKMPENLREDICVVFFDNEEKGLFGSRAFNRRHKDDMSDKILINFDCVGDGSNVLLSYNKKAWSTEERKLLQIAFIKNKAKYKKNLLYRKRLSMLFASDQASFNKGIGVATLRKKKIIGYYAGRIHTGRDIACDDTNIEYITTSAIDFISYIKEKMIKA